MRVKHCGVWAGLLIGCVSGLWIGCGGSGQTKRGSETPESSLQTQKERISYTLGFNAGQQMKRDDFEVDIPALIRGIEDAVAGRQSQLNELERRVALDHFQRQTVRKRQERYEQEAAKGSAEGEAFRAEFAKRPGVKKTKSGILYRVLTTGQGVTPKRESVVRVHYTGRFPDGRVFDSSFQRGEPAEFPLQEVISGWTEILQLMPVGSKWEVVIPPELAYGPGGQGIPPNSTLIFEIELLSIVKP